MRVESHGLHECAANDFPSYCFPGGPLSKKSSEYRFGVDPPAVLPSYHPSKHDKSELSLNYFEPRPKRTDVLREAGSGGPCEDRRMGSSQAPGRPGKIRGSPEILVPCHRWAPLLWF